MPSVLPLPQPAGLPATTSLPAPAARVARPFTVLEKRALQELADRHGSRWRTVLFQAEAKGLLKGALKRLMKRPGAGNEIARATIIPRSLPPSAGFYGPLYFS